MSDRVFEPVPGTDATMFIQWKNTTVCLDFYCPCGHHGHLDEMFAYFVRCPACGSVFEMGTQVRAWRSEAADDDPGGSNADMTTWLVPSVDAAAGIGAPTGGQTLPALGRRMTSTGAPPLSTRGR